MCYVSNAVCDQPCNLIKPCGHHCSGLCGQPCPECQELVETDQVCGHKGLSPCAIIADSKISGISKLSALKFNKKMFKS